MGVDRFLKSDELRFEQAFGGWEWAALQLEQHPEERIHDGF
jgi:hypothetical protein